MEVNAYWPHIWRCQNTAFTGYLAQKRNIGAQRGTEVLKYEVPLEMF